MSEQDLEKGVQMTEQDMEDVKNASKDMEEGVKIAPEAVKIASQDKEEDVKIASEYYEGGENEKRERTCCDYVTCIIMLILCFPIQLVAFILCLPCWCLAKLCSMPSAYCRPSYWKMRWFNWNNRERS